LLETERQPYQAHFNMDRHPRIQTAVYSISVIGPYDAKGPGNSPSRQRILLCTPASPGEEEACAKRILTTLARRAYRRPVTEADLRAPMKFYRDARTESGHETGIEMALRSILVSPEFLFRVEQDPPGVASHSAYRIGEVESPASPSSCGAASRRRTSRVPRTANSATGHAALRCAAWATRSRA
jgi:hypothetical protein